MTWQACFGRSFFASLMFLAFFGTAHAGEGLLTDDLSSQPRSKTHELYSTHAPGVFVPGRYQAGPCVEASRFATNTGADYVPGVDAHGDAVIPADLPPHAAVHWAGPSLQFLAQRTPGAVENRYALAPRDYVTIDGRTGDIYYNDYRLKAGDTLPQPLPCE